MSYVAPLTTSSLTTLPSFPFPRRTSTLKNTFLLRPCHTLYNTPLLPLLTSSWHLRPTPSTVLHTSQSLSVALPSSPFVHGVECRKSAYASARLPSTLSSLSFSPPRQTISIVPTQFSPPKANVFSIAFYKPRILLGQFLLTFLRTSAFAPSQSTSSPCFLIPYAYKKNV